MITKTISISDWVYNTYLIEYRGNNFSKFIEELIVMGANAKLKGEEATQNALMKLHQSLDDLKRENHQLQLQLGRLRAQPHKPKVIRSTYYPPQRDDPE